MKKEIGNTYILLGCFLLSTLIHNLVSAMIAMEEALFFSLGLIAGFAFIGHLIYTVVSYIRGGRAAELWVFGWIGLLGLVGFVPNFGPSFFGLYGFFGFFGLKR